jgi:glycine hydroxymethyltransferase
MGMDLYQGGHLTHGSEFNFSGKRYHVVSYGVSKKDRPLDYDEIRDLVRRAPAQDDHRWLYLLHLGAGLAGLSPHRPRGGRDVYWPTSAIPAGMAIAGAFPSPVGIADVTTFTTHKTLCGPRGAVILTTDEDLANRIDMAVFPGEQGGPTRKSSRPWPWPSDRPDRAFRRLQWKIKENAAALAEGCRSGA